VDFNVAVTRSDSPNQPLGGTPGYMSPEHLDAFDPPTRSSQEAVDARSDVYSLGVVLYELYTGRLPFEPSAKATIQTLAELRRAGPPPLGHDAPAALERVIARCPAARPEDRYQSADELAVALDSCRE